MQKAITDKIREALKGSRFEAVRVAPEDDDEDIIRPSLKIMTDTQYSREILLRVAQTTAEIYFFAEKEDDYLLDCLEVQELAEGALLEGIETEDEILQPDDVDCSISGGVLAISFTLEQMEPVAEEGGTEMESLELNIK
jgi:hypothetical protein